MRNSKVITFANRNQNLFILELAQPGKAMMATIKTISIRPNAMAMTRQGRPTHLVSQNNHICISHCRLTYISNSRVMRTSRLINNIDLGMENKEHKSAEILIESDESDISDLSDPKKPLDSLNLAYTALAYQIRTEDILDKLCKPCIGNKSTRVIRNNKSMTVMTDKLLEVRTNFWSPHDSSSQLESTYAAILIYEHTKMTRILYLRRKNNFVDIFQA